MRAFFDVIDEALKNEEFAQELKDKAFAALRAGRGSRSWRNFQRAFFDESKFAHGPASLCALQVIENTTGGFTPGTTETRVTELMAQAVKSTAACTITTTTTTTSYGCPWGQVHPDWERINQTCEEQVRDSGGKKARAQQKTGRTAGTKKRPSRTRA